SLHRSGGQPAVHRRGTALGHLGIRLQDRPARHPADCGPAADHSLPGPSGHHHGGAGPRQADGHHRHHAVLPAAHRAEHLLGTPGGGPGCEGSRPGHGHEQALPGADGGVPPGLPHGVHRHPHRGGKRHRHCGIRSFRGRRR
ncbi:putative protein conserved in bacteria, partial [Dysosmobacter welbionis]